jgi:hypothetical protein
VTRSDEQETDFMSHLAKDIRRVSSPDGTVVLHLRRGTMFRVNLLGSKVLDLLDRDTSVRQIAELLSVEFGVALDIVEADVKGFMESLRLHGAIDSSAQGI